MANELILATAADGGPKTAERVALVTGCSSGIGRATALRLHRAGFVVYATARRLDTLGTLADQGIKTLALDVTDEDSMTAAVERIEAEHGALTVLVNNAGYELSGPVEEVPLAAARQLFDTNVFGLVRLTQLILPGMRRQGHGRVINLSSIFGRLAVPGGAFYDASKHAVEGFSEALRLEVAPFGIDVTLIEPAATRTQLSTNTASFGNHVDGPYATFHEELERWRTATYGTRTNIAGRLSSTPEDVAAVIMRAATTGRPRAKYPVGLIARGLFALRWWLPARAFDAFVRWQFTSPRAEKRP